MRLAMLSPARRCSVDASRSSGAAGAPLRPCRPAGGPIAVWRRSRRDARRREVGLGLGEASDLARNPATLSDSIPERHLGRPPLRVGILAKEQQELYLSTARGARAPDAASIRISRRRPARFEESSSGVRVCDVHEGPLMCARQLQRQRRPPVLRGIRQRFLGHATHQRMAANPAAPAGTHFPCIEASHRRIAEDGHGGGLHSQAQRPQPDGLKHQAFDGVGTPARKSIFPNSRRGRAASRLRPLHRSAKEESERTHRASVSRGIDVSRSALRGRGCQRTSSRFVYYPRARYSPPRPRRRLHHTYDVRCLDDRFANLNQVCAGTRRFRTSLRARRPSTSQQLPRRDHARGSVS